MSKRYLKYETEQSNPLVDENGVLSGNRFNFVDFVVANDGITNEIVCNDSRMTAETLGETEEINIGGVFGEIMAIKCYVTDIEPLDRLSKGVTFYGDGSGHYEVALIRSEIHNGKLSKIILISITGGLAVTICKKAY